MTAAVVCGLSKSNSAASKTSNENVQVDETFSIFIMDGRSYVQSSIRVSNCEGFAPELNWVILFVILRGLFELNKKDLTNG